MFDRTIGSDPRPAAPQSRAREGLNNPHLGRNAIGCGSKIRFEDLSERWSAGWRAGETVRTVRKSLRCVRLPPSGGPWAARYPVA